MSQRLFELSDLVSFHCYGPAETVEKTLLLCAEEGRPLLCTECLHRNAGNVLEAFLPLFREHKVGWYVWGLVAGKTQTYMPWGSQLGDPTPEVWQHDLFHASGTPYSERELELIREWSFP